MTEESYQQARKLMQQLNYLRGQITTAKNAVAKWTRLEAVYAATGNMKQEENAKTYLVNAINHLGGLRKMWDAIQFPASNLPTPRVSQAYCRICQMPISTSEQYCPQCEENINIPKYDFKHRSDKEVFE